MNDSLRQAMDATAETCETLAEKIGVDPKTVARWLSPGRIPHPRHRRSVARVLNRDVLELWPDPRRGASWFRPWREVEREAIALRSYQPLVVPGLLQTEAYARAVLTEAGLIPRHEVETHVKGRIERQSVFARTIAPTFTAVLDEGVLRRAVGGPAVMRGQLRHLIEVAAMHPHVRIHVVPASAGAYAGLNGPFVLADLEGPRILAYLDTQLSGQMVEEAASISALLSAWESCRGEALPYRQSIELVEELAKTWT